jgi:hypothetical protein
MEDNGLSLWMGMLLFALLMGLLTLLAFRYPDYAPYFVVYAALSGLLAIAGDQRFDFLRQQFGLKRSRQIRWVENFIVTIPWLWVAVWITNPYLVVVLLLMVFAMSFVARRTSKHRLPTPFTRSPFELTVFFRRTYVYVLLVALLVTGIACYADNFNLGIVCLAIVFLVAVSAQEFREHEFFVWSYRLSPSQFLWMKIRRNFVQLLILTVPFWLLLGAVFPQYLLEILLCLFVGLLLNAVYVLMKYAVFPRIFSLPDVLKLLFGILFPLILPFIIYQYYQKARKNLLTWL